jgi:hypothetical protein
MCVQVTKTANRFEISSLLEKILLKKNQVVLNFCRTVYILIDDGILWIRALGRQNQ